MARVLQLLALVLVFVTSGAPAWLAELLEDACAEACAGEDGGCPEEGCADCSVACSSCPRAHVLVPGAPGGLAEAGASVTWLTHRAGERVPIGPPPAGVFHPPRAT